MSLKRGRKKDTCFLFHVTPQTNCFYVFTLCSLPRVNTIFFCPSLTESILLVCALPSHQKENTADSQVGQKHEEPHSWGEGIQEGEVAWSTSLKHTITQRLDHESCFWPWFHGFHGLILCSNHCSQMMGEVKHL